MAIPRTALITDSAQLDKLKNDLLGRLRTAKLYWRPLNLRQDYWCQMYLLLDIIQQSKPIGVARKFVSNEPRTGVDAGLAILTRNPVSWRIPLLNSEDENSEARRTIGRVERTLEGLNYDLDELFSMRLQQPLWKQIFFQGLIRGMIWGKFHVTTDALQYRHSPLIAEIFDARLVYPHVDQWGLNHVLIEKPTNLGDLVASYPGVYGDYEKQGHYDPNTPAVKVEYWSNDRGDRKGINAVLASVGVPVLSGSVTAIDVGGGTMGKDARWLIPPYFHGYTYDELPVVGVPVNGAHIQHKPILLSPLAERLQERADLMSMEALAWHGPASGVAEIGRSILSPVEEQVPQYNELIATIFQHFTINTYDTLVFKTPTGEMPEFERGIGASIALRPDEAVDTLRPQPLTPDAYRLVQLLQDERQKGVLSNILNAVTPFQGTGVLFQQITNAALNSLEPYHSGGTQFGTRMGTCILAQLKKAASEIQPFQLDAMTPKKTFFRVEFDPRDLDQARHYRPIPVLKPALPDDLTVRMTAARMALDPRAPMLSLLTVMETILQIDDPMAELDRIWEDMAMRDPVLLPEIMAQAFDRLDEPEMAQRMRETEFQAAMIEDMKMRQLTGNMPGGQGGAGFTQPTPQAGPLTLSTGRTGTEQNQVEGAEGLGMMGERVGV